MAEFTGDYRLTSVVLKSQSQTIDIKDLVHELNLYESINSVAISADLVVSDNKNLLETTPIIGGESITINVGINEQKFILNFVVYKIDSKVVQEKSQVYILRLCTDDTIKNEYSHYSVAHINKFPNDIVVDLLKNRLGTKKPIEVDKCIYPVSFVNPNRRIFDTVHWLSRKSIPEQNVESAGFLFYETLVGYNFKSIDNLLSRRPKQQFTYTQAKTDLNKPDNKYRIIKFVSEDYFDILSQIRLGSLSNYNIRLDFTTRNKTITKSTLTDVWRHMSHLGDNVPHQSVYSQNPSRVIFTPIINNLFGNSTVGDPQDTDKINKLIDRSIYRYISLDSISVNVEIPGNLDIRAGEVYTLVFPSPDSTGDKRIRQSDNRMTGNWLAHSIKTSINRGYAGTIVKFVKDSYNTGAVLNSSNNDVQISNIG